MCVQYVLDLLCLLASVQAAAQRRGARPKVFTPPRPKACYSVFSELDILSHGDLSEVDIVTCAQVRASTDYPLCRDEQDSLNSDVYSLDVHT